jgi:hypothetical protein
MRPSVVGLEASACPSCSAIRPPVGSPDAQYCFGVTCCQVRLRPRPPLGSSRDPDEGRGGTSCDGTTVRPSRMTGCRFRLEPKPLSCSPRVASGPAGSHYPQPSRVASGLPATILRPGATRQPFVRGTGRAPGAFRRAPFWGPGMEGAAAGRSGRIVPPHRWQ